MQYFSFVFVQIEDENLCSSETDDIIITFIEFDSLNEGQVENFTGLIGVTIKLGKEILRLDIILKFQDGVLLNLVCGIIQLVNFDDTISWVENC